MKKIGTQNLMFFAKIVFLVSVLFIFTTHSVRAECKPNTDGGTSCYKLLSPLPGIGDGSDIVDTTTGLSTYIPGLVKLFFGIISVLAVIMIVIGGLEYMTSGGPGEKKEGKDRIMNAIFGLMLALSSYLILNTINPDLVTLRVTIPSVGFTSIKDDIPGTTQVTLPNGQPGEAGCPQMSGEIEVNTSKSSTASLKKYPLTNGAPWPADDGSTVLYNLYGQNFNIEDNGYVTYNKGSGVPDSGEGGERKLLARNVSVGLPMCTKVQILKGDGTSDIEGKPIIDCASLFGLTDKVLEYAEKLADGCNCHVEIVHGSECWLNKNHMPGKNLIGVKKNPTLDAYIKKNKSSNNKQDCTYLPGFTDAGDGGWCDGTKDASGDYVPSRTKSDNHIRIQVDTSGFNPFVIDEGSYWNVYEPQ